MTYNLFLMYKKPTFRFFVVLTAFLAVFVAFNPLTVEAAGKAGFEGGRYFIGGKGYILKSLFGVQHEFEKGFTADLTSGEVWTLEKIFKIEVTPIPLYKISSPSVVEAVSSPALLGGGASVVSEAVSLVQEKESLKIKTRTIFPTSAITWGIGKIYNDEKLTATAGGKVVNVAVLDTGANIRHFDLIGRVKDCKDFTRGPVPRSACEDKHGHGTHIAGTIGADSGFDGKGVWGVASESGLLIYKVCRNDGTCWADDMAAALDFAVANGANIVSISLGGNSENFIVRNSVENASAKNVLIVAAAGNDGPDKASIDWPAAYKSVVAVGAVAEDLTIPDWSSRGVNDGDYIVEDREIEFGAPGVNVESTWLDGGYRYLSGTSMATPHVSGLAAKIWNGIATSTRYNLQILANDIGILGDDNASGFGLPQLPKINTAIE